MPIFETFFTHSMQQDLVEERNASNLQNRFFFGGLLKDRFGAIRKLDEMARLHRNYDLW